MIFFVFFLLSGSGFRNFCPRVDCPSSVRLCDCDAPVLCPNG